MTKGELDERKIWIDGCFDFAHHGHAGALLQARQLGDELFVGIHTDEAIAHNKGPVVMTLEERVMAVDACKWSTQSVPGAPYVTEPKVMDEYGCKYVVHGDDITTDAHGNDCYQEVKDMGRFVVVKRTPNISTTDLVGRMLSGGTDHHYANPNEQLLTNKDALDRIKLYATGPDGLTAHSAVYAWSDERLQQIVAPSDAVAEGLKAKTLYVDGAFDLFFVAHIEFLRLVRELADRENAKVVVGVHADKHVNEFKGGSFPIMNQFERTLCVLQCQYVDAVVLNAPPAVTQSYMEGLGKFASVHKVVRGATAPKNTDKYAWPQQHGLYHQIQHHKYENLHTQDIVDRVLKCSELYEERQRKKGWKSQKELQMQQAAAN
jgi:ethanolamine-phosphate cytidylyltransferase